MVYGPVDHLVLVGGGNIKGEERIGLRYVCCTRTHTHPPTSVYIYI